MAIPLRKNVTVTIDLLSFQRCPSDTVEIPMLPHPGAYGFKRQHHVHEGIDLYTDEKTPVYAMTKGIVEAVIPFTGEIADSPWWEDTYAVIIKDDHASWLYGEITTTLNVGDNIQENQLVGHVKKVLKVNKGRPMSMLHLERRLSGHHSNECWTDVLHKPSYLLDPLPELLKIYGLL